MKRRLLDLLCCPQCRGDLGLEAATIVGDEVIYGQLRCQQCEASYPIDDGIPRMCLSADPGADIWGDYWESYGRSLVDRMVNRILSPMLIRACARAVLLHSGPSTVLEVGGGLAQTSLRLSEKRGDEIINLDIAPRALQMARAESARRRMDLLLVQGNAASIPMKSDSVGVAFNVGTMEHFEDPVPVVKEMARVARTVICAAPTDGLVWRLGRVVRSYTEEDPSLWTKHTKLFDVADMLGVFERAGFEGTKVYKAGVLGLSLLAVGVGVKE